jgi:hypothetical protein
MTRLSGAQMNGVVALLTGGLLSCPVTLVLSFWFVSINLMLLLWIVGGLILWAWISGTSMPRRLYVLRVFANSA